MKAYIEKNLKGSRKKIIAEQLEQIWEATVFFNEQSSFENNRAV